MPQSIGRNKVQQKGLKQLRIIMLDSPQVSSGHNNILGNFQAYLGVKKLRRTWRVLPEASVAHRGSLINSQPKMVGSSLYSTPVIVFFLVKTVCRI